jgi:hypothetical protein
MLHRAHRSAFAMMFVTAALGCEASPPESAEPACTGSDSRLTLALSKKCFGREPLEATLDPKSPAFGTVNCRIFEEFRAGSQACSCEEAGLAPSGDVPDIVYEALGCPNDPCCSESCLCEFIQLRGDELAACQNGTEYELDPDPIGWCYIDPDQGLGDPSLVDDCSPFDRRIIRMLTPHSTWRGAIACM